MPAKPPKVVQRVKAVTKDGIAFEADLLDDGTVRVDKRSLRKVAPPAEGGIVPIGNEDAFARYFDGRNENATPDKQKILGPKDSPDPAAPKSIFPWKHYGSARNADGTPQIRKVIT